MTPIIGRVRGGRSAVIGAPDGGQIRRRQFKEEVVPAGDSPADPHIPGNACVSRAVFGVPPNTFRIPRNPASIALNAATNYD
jgi:hypothetical protein